MLQKKYLRIFPLVFVLVGIMASMLTGSVLRVEAGSGSSTSGTSGTSSSGSSSSDTVDLDCYRQKIFNPGLDCEDSSADYCSALSADEQAADKKACEENGGVYNTSNCTCNKLSTIEKFFPRTNFDGSIGNISELTRLIFTVLFMIIGIISVFIGLYGMYLYTSAENPEDVQNAQKVFKNALIGLAISAGGVIIVSVIFMFLGLDAEDVFTFKVS